MENSIWRPRARIVSIIELVLVWICILCFVLIICTNVYYIHKDDYSALKELETFHFTDDAKLNASCELGMYVVNLIMAGIFLWITLKLRISTTIGQDPGRALKMVKIWITVRFILLVLSVVTDLALWMFWAALLNIVWDAVVIAIVYMYFRELKVLTSSQLGNYPVHVTLNR